VELRVRARHVGQAATEEFATGWGLFENCSGTVSGQLGAGSGGGTLHDQGGGETSTNCRYCFVFYRSGARRAESFLVIK